MTAIDDKIAELQAQAFDPGDPTGDEVRLDDGRAYRECANIDLFEDSAGVVWMLWGAALAAYNDTGGVISHGFPLSTQEETGRDQQLRWTFEQGTRIYEFTGEPPAAFAIWPPLSTIYEDAGGPAGELGALGAMVTGEAGVSYVHFEFGHGLYDVGGQVFRLDPAVDRAYWENGGPAGSLGAPTTSSNTDPASSGSAAIFTNGTLFVEADGTSQVQMATGGWPRFRNSAEIDAWFNSHATQSDFIAWFNATQAKKGAWSPMHSRTCRQRSTELI
jgi:hypothetical protein